MGASVTTNVQTTVQDTITEINQRQVQAATTNTQQRNDFRIRSDGPVVIRGGELNQRNTATVNMKQVARGMTNSSVQQQMEAVLRQQAMSENKDFNIFQLAVATNITDTTQRNTHRLSQDIRQSCEATASQQNNISIDTTNKQGVELHDWIVNQDNDASLSANCAHTAIAQSETSLLFEFT